MNMIECRPSDAPCVFLLGCDRSGTTLVRSILNNHPDVMISYEAPASVTLVETFQQYGMRATIEAMRSFEQFDAVDWLHVFDRLDEVSDVTLADVVAAANNNLLQQNGKHIWGDKTPAYTRFVDTLASMYPNSVFVHIVRDPRAVAASWVQTDWGPNTAFHAGREWQQRVSEADRSLKQLPESRVAVIRFEDFLVDPEKTIQPVCQRIGVPYTSAMLQERDLESDALPTRFFQKLHAKSQERLDPSRTDRWRSIDDRKLALIESQTWELMQLFGYEPTRKTPPSVTNWDRLSSKVHNRLRQVTNQLKQKQSPPVYPLPTH
ncbi:sulfotransferase family protein [Stieleria marina]|uniref:Sulfotransferase domain protein n=1 Tax=Stieleria marina TaxID=1930275 RepID=A0A517NNS6_9BACT|nr:Sulfotransferase domain protein [Planctomycetes bacterium K23_9]